MTPSVEQILAELERTATPATLERVRALVSALLDAHAAGLGKLMALLDARGEAGRAIAREATRDRAIESLLLLHGLHPIGLHDRVQAALDGVAPALRAQGAEAKILVAAEGRVEIRIDALPGGLPRSNVRSIIENALIEAAPDAACDVAIGFDDAATFVPVSRLGAR